MPMTKGERIQFEKKRAEAMFEHVILRPAVEAAGRAWLKKQQQKVPDDKR